MIFNQLSTALPDSTEMHRSPRPGLRVALIVAAYFCAFILLDLFSQQFEGLQGVVVWYPPAGLTYTLLLVFGVNFAPAVAIALMISSLFIYRMPQPAYLLFVWALMVSTIYSVAAGFLRQRIHFDWQLRKLRDVGGLVVTAVLVSALLAVLSISSSALSSDMPRSEVFRAIFHWWIGETVGVLTITPFLLIYVMPGLKRFAEGQPFRLPARGSFPRLSLAVIGQVAGLAFTLYWVFGAHILDEFQPIYLIILPLIWIALQHGLKGVTLGIAALNFGIMLAVWFFRFDLARLSELQLLMIVDCIIGLLMGASVTERKRAEEEIHQLNASLEEGIEMRTRELHETQEKLIRQERLAVLGQVAGSIGHELRNPLGVISNAVYFLKLVQPEVNDKVRQYHGIIEQEVRSAEKIITDLLDFARLKSADRKPYSIPDLLQRALDHFPAPPSVEVVLELPNDLPLIFVDPRQMEQVLGNLITNACQAMKDGGSLTLSARRQEELAVIAVQDTGTGIPPENLQQLFEPLFTTKIKGIGLGLAVSKKLTEANGGRIEVESVPGMGSTFLVYLPIVR